MNLMYLILYNKMCPKRKDLHNSVNHCFTLRLGKKDPFKAQERAIDFNVTTY